MFAWTFSPWTRTARRCEATTLMPSKGESYFSIDHGQKVIVEMPYSTLATTSKQVTGSGDNANLEIKKLGKATVSGVETRHIRVIDKDNRTVIDLWLTQKYPADLWTRAFRGRNLGLELSDDERSKAMKKYGVKPGFFDEDARGAGRRRPRGLFGEQGPARAHAARGLCASRGVPAHRSAHRTRSLDGSGRPCDIERD